MKTVLLFFVTAIMISSSVMAQRQQMSAEERAQRQAERIQQQTERMSKELGLSGDAKTEFETAYKQYQKELLDAIGQEQQRRQEDKKADQMSDEECYQKIKESITQQEKQIEQSQKRLEITKKYMAQFITTLSAQQMYKVFGQRQQSWGGQNGQQRNWNGNGGGQRGGFGGQGGYGGGQRGGFGGGF